MWEAGKIVAAVCHGPIALLNAKLSDDSLLIAGKSYTAFTNAEENAMGKYDVVATTPGTCQEAMTAVGGIFKPAGPWASNVVIDGNLFTGQNPQSAGDLAQAIIYRFDELAAEFEPPEVCGNLETARTHKRINTRHRHTQSSCTGCVEDTLDLLMLTHPPLPTRPTNR